MDMRENTERSEVTLASSTARGSQTDNAAARRESSGLRRAETATRDGGASCGLAEAAEGRRGAARWWRRFTRCRGRGAPLGIQLQARDRPHGITFGIGPLRMTARDADRRRGDHLDVDALGGQRIEQVRRDARMGLHAGPHERHLRDLVVDREPLGPDLLHDPLHHGLQTGNVGEGRGEGEVGRAFVRLPFCTIIMSDADAIPGHGTENHGRYTRPVRHGVRASPSASACRGPHLRL